MPDLVPASTRFIAGGMQVALPIALGIALALTLLYVGSTAKKKGERKRRRDLALTSFVAGPAVGALIAWSEIARGRVGAGPLNAGDAYEKCIGMGVFVGVLVALAFLMTAALAPAEGPKPPADPEI